MNIGGGQIRGALFNFFVVKIQMFPDSRASICLAGPHHLDQMGLKHHNLMPSQEEVKAAGGSKLLCCGWLPINFTIGMHINQSISGTKSIISTSVKRDANKPIYYHQNSHIPWTHKMHLLQLPLPLNFHP